MKIVIFGLAITSSWGNGHATTFRGAHWCRASAPVAPCRSTAPSILPATSAGRCTSGLLPTSATWGPTRRIGNPRSRNSSCRLPAPCATNSSCLPGRNTPRVFAGRQNVRRITHLNPRSHAHFLFVVAADVERHSPRHGSRGILAISLPVRGRRLRCCHRFRPLARSRDLLLTGRGDPVAGFERRRGSLPDRIRRIQRAAGAAV
jgi:hypothetical protein